MSLSSYEVRTSIGEPQLPLVELGGPGQVGHAAGEEQSDESRVYACGGGTSLHVYESPRQASQGTATLATWYVPDLEAVVDELASNGVAFERYHDPTLKVDEKGIHELEDGRVAWFRDPDGNTFAVEQESKP
jgi:catechol 2,3-dioxygenase-like lactoylglutathione lyase family enzyme